MIGAKTTPRKIAGRFRELMKPNPILMHGKRVEAMFAFVAAALDRCVAIREEDVGTVYGPEGLQAPDYRVVLDGGAEILIEVKNCHETTKPLRLQTDYLQRLAAYGKVFNRPVKLAIYWSRWRTWTLVLLEDLRARGGKAEIHFTEALMCNDMVSLGDYAIGTTSPLIARIFSDPTEPRRAGRSEQEIDFRIQKIELFCGGRQVIDKNEKNIAWYLMMFGRWPQRQHAQIESDELIWLDFIAEPEMPADDEKVASQPFHIVGEASGLIARHFDFRTVSLAGEIERLQPSNEPNRFGLRIPPDYAGRDVKLWRLYIQPRRAEA